MTKPIAWLPNPGRQQYKEVRVPKGFVTDFASIPQAFWSLLRPDGEYTYPAILHDWLYWSQEESRDQADEIFKLAMEDFKIAPATIAIVYNAVRLAGESSWNDNTIRRTTKGEKRVLKRYPEDPRITWDQWRKEPGVFSP